METEAHSVFRVALAQVNFRVGDIEGNTRKIIKYVNEAREKQADLVAFPELSVTGYPPEDLLLKSSFIRESQEAVGRVVANTKGIIVIVGFPCPGGALPGGPGGAGPAVGAGSDAETNAFCAPIFNAAAVACNGKLIAVCTKMVLPNYGVFDEKRYFAPGRIPLVFEPVGSRGAVPPGVRAASGARGWGALRALKGPRFGVNICEDIWSPGVARLQARAGALVIINISCSPYHVGKGEARDGMLSARSSETGAAVCYVNLVGGQDELVFDGESVIVGPNGRPIARAPQFEEALLVVDIDVTEIARKRKTVGKPGAGIPAAGPQPGRAQMVRIAGWGEWRAGRIGRGQTGKQKQAVRSTPMRPSVTARLKPVEEVYRALVLGTRDYVTKNGFKKVAIGLSGGIDSSLVAAIAVDALGADNVRGILMPSRYTSKKSNEDALVLATNLRVKTMTIPIEEVFGAYLSTLRPAFARKRPDITEENIQARIRGNVLMALSNKFGWLVLTTGNKSEVAVGYSTLYGDTAGGFAVIKDVPKTLVYRLARFRNSIPPRGVIPGSVLTKAPTAELRPNQKDQDSLPPYATLDPILEAYVERDRSCDEIVARGFAPEVVDRVVSMVDASEYKRRQAPPGIRISPRAFGRDRRLPITNKFRG